MSTTALNQEHEICYENAIKLFYNSKKMGGDQYSQLFLQKLEEDIFEQYESWVKVNNGKNLFKSMRTPAVLVVFLTVTYIFQEIFQLVGLNMLASICSAFLGLILVTIGIWAYSRYSGNMREIGFGIDEITTWIWTNILAPLTQEGVQKAVILSRRLAETSNYTHAASLKTGRYLRLSKEQ